MFISGLFGGLALFASCLLCYKYGYDRAIRAMEVSNVMLTRREFESLVADANKCHAFEMTNVKK